MITVSSTGRLFINYTGLNFKMASAPPSSSRLHTKRLLRLGLLVYMAFLLVTPSFFSLYNLVVDGLSSLVAILSILQFINYLRSRFDTACEKFRGQHLMD